MKLFLNFVLKDTFSGLTAYKSFTIKEDHDLEVNIFLYFMIISKEHKELFSSHSYASL